MSKICICVINRGDNDFFHLKEIETLFNNCNLKIFFKFEYIEPCIADFIDNNSFCVFSIADNREFDNCEMLLLPDNCELGGKRNKILFYYRMMQLQGIFEKILKRGNLELFVGDSGTEFFEFEEVNIKVLEFAEVSNLMLNTTDDKNFRFIITGTENTENTGDGSVC